MSALTDAVVGILAESPDLTRAQLSESLAARGEELSGMQLMLLCGHLEMEVLICSGVPRRAVVEECVRVLPSRGTPLQISTSISRWPHSSTAASAQLFATRCEGLAQLRASEIGRLRMPTTASVRALIRSASGMQLMLLCGHLHLEVAAQQHQLVPLADRMSALTDAVLGILAESPDLTRAQLSESLAARGEELSGMQLMLLCGHLEMEVLICSGVPREGEHTYALFDDRVRRRGSWIATRH